MSIPWKKLDSKLIYENPWLRLREDQVVRPDGSQGIYSVVERRRGVTVIVVNDEGKICLVRQYRYPTQMYSWETPMGTSDEGEDALAAAKRELKEETGLTATTWQAIEGPMQLINGFSDELMSVFVATGLVQTESNDMAEEGIDTVAFFSAEEIIAMIDRGEITDAPTLGALIKTFIFFKYL